uniref:Uncharacterized protein n=1 Tax=Glossina morsitans morsitans TaxID=37546 RepID=A0A1B0FB33_GLOMM
MHNIRYATFTSVHTDVLHIYIHKYIRNESKKKKKAKRIDVEKPGFHLTHQFPYNDLLTGNIIFF